MGLLTSLAPSYEQLVGLSVPGIGCPLLKVQPAILGLLAHIPLFGTCGGQAVSSKCSLRKQCCDSVKEYRGPLSPGQLFFGGLGNPSALNQSMSLTEGPLGRLSGDRDGSEKVLLRF